MVEIKLVKNKAELKEYIYLPAKLHSKKSNWVPPIYNDEWGFHNPKKNIPLAKSDVILALAYLENRPVGRIMGIIPQQYNVQLNEKTARFFQLECIESQEVVHKLIYFVENWASKNGMNQIIGPYGFSDTDPQGLQIEGLEYLPVIATPTNQAYLKDLVEKEGYAKLVDCISLKLDIPAQIPVFYQKIFERINQNPKIKLVEFSKRNQLKKYIIPVFRLVNVTYASLFGFVPKTEAEMKKMADQYLPILDPAFVKIVVDSDNEVIAFAITAPDMSLGIKKANGKLFPFGFLKILWAMKKSKQLDLLLGAVRPDYRGKGLIQLMGVPLLKEAQKRKMTHIDSHLILETNTQMQAEIAKLGATIYKRYRVYQKSI